MRLGTYIDSDIYSQLLNSVQTGTNIRFISVMELRAPANI
jgi:hypothetical protein